MSIVSFKRLQMLFDLNGPLLPLVALPSGYRVLPWSPELMERHARAKCDSFQHELDANVFPCLGHKEGCLQLMRDIAGRETFVPLATWLIEHNAVGSRRWTPCGTIQGLIDLNGYGAIQNVGVSPDHRGKGLGRHLLARALDGFHRVGLSKASLEVTAENEDAFRLYRRIGFVPVRVVFKTVELDSSIM